MANVTTKKSTARKKSAATKAPAEKPAAKAPEPKNIVIVDEDPPAAVEQEEVLAPTLNNADFEMIANAVTRGVVAAMQAMPASPQIAPAERSERSESGYGAELKKAALADEEYSPGGRQVESESLETIPVIPEEAAGWTEEQVAEFNRREAAKLRARKKAQAANRKDLEGLGTAERMRRMMAPRDPTVVRYAIPKDWGGDESELVQVVCKRKIGLDENGTMSDIGETVNMPRDHARRLQGTGAIEVAI